jgi:hypothetical protein
MDDPVRPKTLDYRGKQPTPEPGHSLFGRPALFLAVLGSVGVATALVLRERRWLSEDAAFACFICTAGLSILSITLGLTSLLGGFIERKVDRWSLAGLAVSGLNLLLLVPIFGRIRF